jgi:hypothetical protein
MNGEGSGSALAAREEIAELRQTIAAQLVSSFANLLSPWTNALIAVAPATRVATAVEAGHVRVRLQVAPKESAPVMCDAVAAVNAGPSTGAAMMTAPPMATGSGTGAGVAPMEVEMPSVAALVAAPL